MKEALLKAGFRSKETENERPQMRKKDKTKRQVHQEQRNYCENCGNICPDVEFYKHRIPSVSSHWICCRCADLHSIPDESRQTAQSDFSKGKTFRRQYGPTKRF